MLAIKGTYQNGKVLLDNPVPVEKKMKVIVTFIDEEITDDSNSGNKHPNIKESHKQENDNEKKQDKSILQKFSFMQSIEATRDFDCSFSDALIEERRSEL